MKSANDDIALNVSQSIKEKLIKGEYVDLSIFINSSTNESNRKHYIFQPGSVDSTIKTKQITNIEIWTDAFIVQLNIYHSAHNTRTIRSNTPMPKMIKEATHNTNPGEKNMLVKEAFFFVHIKKLRNVN